MILDDDAGLVVQPDLVFVTAGRADIVADQVHGAPDLAIEDRAGPHVILGAVTGSGAR